MATKYRQISLKDTFSDCQDMFIEDTPSFFHLLDEHFDINEFIAGKHTRNHATTKADVFLAGIASQLTVIVAFRMNCPEYIRSLKPLVA